MADEYTRADLHYYLDQIQNIIVRMSQYSQLIKGWTITFIPLILTYASSKSSPVYIYVIIGLAFLGLMSMNFYTLRTEKQYRKLYKKVISKKDRLEDIDYYNLDITDSAFDVPFKEVISSWSFWIIHGLVIVSFFLLVA